MSNWQDLGRDVTKLRHKVDTLDRAWEKVDRKLNDLVNLAETAKLITFLCIFSLMLGLLLRHFG